MASKTENIMSKNAAANMKEEKNQTLTKKWSQTKEKPQQIISQKKEREKKTAVIRHAEIREQ